MPLRTETVLGLENKDLGPGFKFLDWCGATRQFLRLTPITTPKGRYNSAVEFVVLYAP